MTQAIDPIAISHTVESAYQRYLTSLVTPKDPGIAAALRSAIQEEAARQLVKGPYLETTPPYLKAGSPASLISEGVLSESFGRLESSSFPLDRPLYAHQESSIRAIRLPSGCARPACGIRVPSKSRRGVARRSARRTRSS